ncbi:MAG TPA: opioid growth factor receptor-related protein [Bryobacteraceae bacterium]|jgi:hypothetical protein|nr:opioid growth factor receptor-related protein [Bryobacteraceae bacterium]
MTDSAILRFYRGSGDSQGRSLDQIWAWPPEWLESTHDYIQWLFPLDEPSDFNSHAPILTGDDIAAFRNDPLLQASLQQSLDVMLRFYGLESESESGRITRSRQFGQRAGIWLTPDNHNHLRLTRILKSLTLLGLEESATRLFKALEEIYVNSTGRIGRKSYEFWKAAVRRVNG